MKGTSKESNFYTHQVKIKIEGFKIDRLLNKALKEHIRIRQLKVVSETELECYISFEELQELKRLARSLYKITVIENVGMVFRIKSFLKKPMWIALSSLVFILVISQSFFVKTIEIAGYKGIPEIELRKCLDEVGISENSYIPAIDWQAAERHIYDVFPEVSWLQLVYDGRKVFLNISEGDVISNNDESQQKSVAEILKNNKEKCYCNIIASRDGYIESINNYRGVALVEEGDFVNKGQVLILGCVPIKEKYHREDAPTEYYVKAHGEIWATVPYRLTFTQQMYDEKGQVKGEKQILEKSNQQIRNWCKENLPEKAEILNKDLNFSYKENIIEIGVTLEIRQQIGEEQEILIGQKNSDSSGY